MKVTNDRFSKPTWAFVIGGVVAVLGLTLVLGMTILRVQNPEPTIDTPQAAGLGCNANSPAKVWSCYQDTGNCSGCIAYNDGGPYPSGGGGNNTGQGCNPNSPAKVWSCYQDTGNCSGCIAYNNGGSYPTKSGSNTCFDDCFKNIKPGNGSYCRTYCEQGSTCFDNCFKNIKPGNGSYCRSYCENLPTPTPVPSVSLTPIPGDNSSQVNLCWGNATGLGGRCYDCNGDRVVNILDFTCFARNWTATIN